MKEAEILRCKLIQNIGGNVVQTSHKRMYSGPSYPYLGEMPKGFSVEEGTWSEFSGVFMI